MVSLFFLLCGVFCVLVQTNLSFAHLFFPLKPDLTIPLTVYIALSQGAFRGSLYVLWVGFIMDLTSGGATGLYLFTRQSMFFISYLAKKYGFLDSVPLQGFLTIAFFFLDAIIISLTVRVGGDSNVEPIQFFQHTGSQAVFTLLIWFLFYPALRKIEGLVVKPD
jgi:rod shape-determining protein MreD